MEDLCRASANSSRDPAATTGTPGRRLQFRADQAGIQRGEDLVQIEVALQIDFVERQALLCGKLPTVQG